MRDPQGGPREEGFTMVELMVRPSAPTGSFTTSGWQ
jgi:hypothetical protein